MTRSEKRYDAIIVGARCAGAALGMLLARGGMSVLVIDRSRHGADTLSTHALMRAGVSLLARWGVLDAIVDAGTPTISSTTFHYGDERVDIDIEPRGGVPGLFAPRRTVLDAALVDAAAEAGAEVRFGVSLQSLRYDSLGYVRGVTVHDGQRRLEIDANIVIGADGMRSTVARELDLRPQTEGSYASSAIYAYWPGLPQDAYHWYYRPGVAAGLIPTNDGDACVFVGAPSRRFREELRHDVAAGYRRILEEAAPELAARLDGAPASGFRAFPGHVGYFRRCVGPGWALVGDAGYFKDPLTAHGITDALRDAQLLARAMLTGGRRAMFEYQTTRNELSSRFFTATERVASFLWDLPMLGELHRDMAKAQKREQVYIEGLFDQTSSPTVPFHPTETVAAP